MRTLTQFINESRKSIHKIADKGDYLNAFKYWLIWDTDVPEEDKRSGILASEYIEKNGSKKGLVDHLISLIKNKEDDELVDEYNDFVSVLKNGETYYAIHTEHDGTIVWDDLA